MMKEKNIKNNTELLALLLLVLVFFLGIKAGAGETPNMSESVTLYLFDGDLRGLPSEQTWKSDDAIREVLLLETGSESSMQDCKQCEKESEASVEQDVENLLLPKAK